MDKEKEIEEMAHRSSACEHPDRHCLKRYGDCSECSVYSICEDLIDAGYGNVKQAVKEFAEELKAEINALPKDILICSIRHQAPELIDKTFKKLYG